MINAKLLKEFRGFLGKGRPTKKVTEEVPGMGNKKKTGEKLKILFDTIVTSPKGSIKSLNA